MKTHTKSDKSFHDTIYWLHQLKSNQPPVNSDNLVQYEKIYITVFFRDASIWPKTTAWSDASIWFDPLVRWFSGNSSKLTVKRLYDCARTRNLSFCKFSPWLQLGWGKPYWFKTWCHWSVSVFVIGVSYSQCSRTTHFDEWKRGKIVLTTWWR